MARPGLQGKARVGPAALHGKTAPHGTGDARRAAPRQEVSHCSVRVIHAVGLSLGRCGG